MIDNKELSELSAAMLTGVTVGVGSQILLFGTGASLVLQCPFKCEIRGDVRWGHGEEISTCMLLFDFLNCYVEKAFVRDGKLELDFGGVGCLTIVPERNGLESYVLNTQFGITPVLLS